MGKYHFTYQTTNIINGKTYIGVHSTMNINDGYLGSGFKLLQAISKYGKDNFHREILSFFDTKEEAFQAESILVNEIWVKDRNNYNMTIGGSTPPSWKGKKISKERIDKLRASRKGYKATEETRLKISEAVKGRFVSEETRKKKSDSMKGKNTGKQSPEHIEKLKIARRNRPPVSEETRIKISIAGKGRKVTREAIEKRKATRLANGGWKHSESQIDKLKLAHARQTKEEKIKRYQDRSKCVMVIMAKTSEIIGVYYSIGEASRQVGVTRHAIVSLIENNNIHLTKGFIFKYA